MILNILNNLVAIFFGLFTAVNYFLVFNVPSASKIFIGIGQAFLMLVIAWIACFILIWLFFIFVALTINPKKEYKKISPFYYGVFNLWYSYITSFFRVKVKATGLENIPTNQRFLTVCNHRSNLDNMIQSKVLKKHKIAFISKIENFHIPLANQYMTRSLYLAMDRKDVRKSLQTILKAIDYIKNNVVSIGVFPEGTRSKTGKLLDFKPGCLKIAEKTKCPIVVCCLDGSEKINKNFPWKKTIVNFDVIKVYSTQELESLKTVNLSDEIRNLMLQKLGQ